MKKKSYLLLGLGIGNLAVKEYLDKQQISYLIYDDNLKEYKKDIDFNSFEIVIKSSGLKDDHYIAHYSKKLGKKIITDLEFFYLYTESKKIITVTGSNGKTTTVSLIHHLLDNLDMGGNIGVAVSNFIDSKNDIVIEASSFMLDHIEKFKANINIYTNIHTNHLDHHESLKKYIRAKLKLINNIESNDYLIYNYDDHLLRRMFQNLDVKKIEYSINSKIDGLYLEDNNVYYKEKFICNLDGILLKGSHNHANILAAIAALIAYDKTKIHNLERLKLFKGLEHRIEYIGKINNIKVFNDSKSTNFTALKTSIKTFPNEKILLICGGKLREDDYDLINNELKQIEFVIINGQNKEVLAKYFEDKQVKYIIVATLEEAIEISKNYLKDISVLLFSPGSSSYDQFKNFEQRGQYFKNKIREIYELNK